jgi:hypothetical protein
MTHDIQTHDGPMTLINDAFAHSALRAEFQSTDRNQEVDIQIYQVIHETIPQISGIAVSSGLSQGSALPMTCADNPCKYQHLTDYPDIYTRRNI